MATVLNLDLLARVTDMMVLQRHAARAAIEPHSALIGDLGMNMTAISSLSMDVFHYFDVALPHSEWSEWQTVADVVRSIMAGSWSAAA